MKKIGFISDLHVNYLEKPHDDISEKLQQVITEKNLDCLVIGGDIADHYSETIAFVEELEAQLKISIFFIPGNHDYWEKAKHTSEIDTWQIYKIFSQHKNCLIGKNIQLSDTVTLLGHSLWYNHAFHDNRFSEDRLEMGVYEGRTWQDKINTNWHMSDIEVSNVFTQEVKDQLDTIPDNHEIILVTHMVTIQDFCVNMPHPVFDYFNAFIGTNDIEPFYAAYPIKHTFMGHVHYRRDFVQNDDIHYYVNCLGYQNEWRTDDLYTELLDALVVLEIN